MITPILESDRLILLPLRVVDAEEAFANWTSDPDVATHMKRQGYKNDRDTTQSTAEKVFGENIENNQYH